MRIAVFSDIHGNLEALQAILDDIKKDKFDDVIYLGDAINIGPSSLDCLELLLDSNIRFILGNHDLYFIKGIDKFDIEDEKIEHYKYMFSQLSDKIKIRLKNLPLFYDLEVNGHTFRFNHYFIKNIKNIYPFFGIGTIKKMKVTELLNNIDTEYTFYGHDHEPCHLIFNHKHLIDIGSSGCVKDDKTFYTILNIDKDVSVTVKKIHFNRTKFEDKLKNSNYPLLEHYAKGFYGIDDLHKEL